MKLKCLVVDDEPLARELLKDYIERLNPTLILQDVCDNAIKAQGILSKNEIDILFIDIEMPNINGFDFIKSLNNPPYTVFTTAYSEFAVASYELNNVFDYLIKPIAFSRFIKTVNKFVDIVNNNSYVLNRENNYFKKISIPIEKEEKSKYLFLKQDGKIIKLDHSEIFFIESFGEYVKVNIKNKRVVSRLSLSKLMDNLPSNQFIRIHRSYIVNVKFITHIEGNQVVVCDDAKIPISRSKKDELLDFIKTHGYLD
ncbi:LytR/AlgR family response regulator transcription factor [Polaribacter cellanae]|uniref:Response regulator transcription factor n=1 Tax=Polaribacter cellanae TaxID=2818493 RepID=A0A975CTS4_9FLAO|nr:LytTR family DNA-binding domain-containing protein [Polaribacter cellanae]QTE23261.1 response regulator transcription factor [Polaribacter cellanae]